MKRLLIVTILLISTQVVTTSRVAAQDRPGNFTQQRRELLIYNAAFGGLTSGVGSLINKKPGQSRAEAFGRGFYRGVIGGVLTGAGKTIAYRIHSDKNLHYGWVAKAVHSTGVSLMENAAANRGWLDTWSTDLGPLRLDVRPKEKNFLRARIQPLTTFAFGYQMATTKLDAVRSLQLGTPYFLSSRIKSVGLESASGRNIANCITLKATNQYRTTAHEFLHTLQNREYLVISKWLDRTDGNLKARRGWYNTASRYIYLDMPWFGAAYGIEHINYLRGGTYNSNFFEYEVKNFSEHRYIRQ